MDHKKVVGTEKLKMKVERVGRRSRKIEAASP
jgi:hypothetical protein